MTFCFNFKGLMALRIEAAVRRNRMFAGLCTSLRDTTGFGHSRLSLSIFHLKDCLATSFCVRVCVLRAQ